MLLLRYGMYHAVDVKREENDMNANLIFSHDNPSPCHCMNATINHNSNLSIFKREMNPMSTNNIYYPEGLEEFYIEVLIHKLNTKEKFDLLCFIDDGRTDELLELLSRDCKEWFPEEFEPGEPKLLKEDCL